MTNKIPSPVAGDAPDGPPAGDEASAPPVRYQLSPRATFVPFDTSISAKVLQLVLEDRHYYINEQTLSMLQQFAMPATIQDAETNLAEIPLGTPASRRQSIESAIAFGMLVPTGQSVENALARPLAQRTNPLPLKRRLLSQQQLLPLTRPLQHLFNKLILGPCVALAALAYICAIVLHDFARVPPLLGKLGAGQWVCFLILNYTALFWHELGHSAACLRGGARHGDIGCGIYLWYPIFYADVTPVWALRRIDRIRVDIGGIYFHSLAGALCYALWLVSHQDVLLLGMYAIALSIVVNLNPFLKFDGYWLLTDLLGLPNLRGAARDALYGLLPAVFRSSGAERRTSPRAGRAVETTVLMYALATGVFSVWMITHVLFVVIPSIWRNIAGIGELLRGPSLDHRAMAVFGALLRLVFSGLAAWGLSALLGRMARQALRMLSLQLRRPMGAQEQTLI
jgi:putative peptide zinc metalloprotease protein